FWSIRRLGSIGRSGCIRVRRRGSIRDWRCRGLRSVVRLGSRRLGRWWRSRVRLRGGAQGRRRRLSSLHERGIVSDTRGLLQSAERCQALVLEAEIAEADGETKGDHDHQDLADAPGTMRFFFIEEVLEIGTGGVRIDAEAGAFARRSCTGSRLI